MTTEMTFSVGTLISVWKPKWKSHHFGFVDEHGEVIHYRQDAPTCFVEMQVGDNQWKRCPIEDYEFVSKTLAGLSEVKMRSC